MSLATSPPQEIASAPGSAWLARRSTHVAAILLLALALYAPTLRGTFDFDTPVLVLYNPAVHGFSLANLRAVLASQPNGVEYLPVRDLTYMLDFDVWGLRALGFHLSNVLYYAAGCAALYLLLERVLARWSDRPRALAAAAALLFVLHPVHVESVAGIAQRKDVVSGLLCFASLLAFQAWLERGGWRPYALALGAFVLAVLAKATAVVVPGLALLAALPHVRRDRRVQAGLAGLGVAAVALAAFSAAQAVRSGILWESTASPWLRALTFGRAAAWYAQKLAAPWPLSSIYDLQPVSDPLDARALAALAAVVAVAAAAAWKARRRPVLAFSVGWFLVAVVPVSGLAAAPNLVADRYLFVPSVAFCVAAAWVGVHVLAARSRAVAGFAAAAMALAHAGVVAVRVVEWRTNGSLLLADVARNPESARLAGLLGRYHYANRRYAEAFAQFDRARAIDPEALDAVFYAALFRLESGDPAGALTLLGALGDLPIVDVQCLLGMALERLGRVDEARERYERALRANRIMGVIYRTTAAEGAARLAPRGGAAG
ncbi:MAG TPA: glycosyltransferase family 39 protein [Anaeromyxobacter sp.]|nr:glycosyltransferase family 39 protein [Anaeromyxobacter sp.]